MTSLEAFERAEKIWGEGRVIISPAKGTSHKPGEVEWWVDVGKIAHPKSHSLDCNGHAVCHQECADAEVQICTPV